MAEKLTKAEAIKLSLVEVTEACRPDDLVETTSGKIRFDKWCEQEIARLNAVNRPAVVVFVQNGKISLWAEPLPPHVMPPALTVD